ncbi:MAG TPA: MerR family transcriptional regulator [Nannocystis sp.]|jgi:DNA-binding transcriptional MerR regulator
MVRQLPKPRRTFVRTDEVLKAAGVSFVTLREWIRRGILPEPLETARGRGNLGKYPRSAVARAELARRLRDDGWTLDEIAEHMRSLSWETGSSTGGAVEPEA